MEKDVLKIIESLAETAQTATEDAYEYVQQKSKNATDAVSEKSAIMRHKLELARLKTEQDRQFADVGRMMFLVRSGKAKNDEPYGNGGKTPQQTIDALFIIAEQYQQQIDAVNAKIAEAKAKADDKNICAACGHECADNDAFCSHCGAKL